MKKLAFLFAALLLVSVVGCSSTSNPVAPDSADQSQSDNSVQKPDANPGDPTGGLDGKGDPGGTIGGP